MNQIYPHPNQPGQDSRAIVVSDGMGVPQQYRQNSGPYPNYPYFDQDQNAEPNFDFLKYVRIALKHKWLIIGSVVTTMLLATALTFLMTPIYRATASIQIDREAIEVIDVKNLQPEDTGNGLDFYQTQYGLLASRSLAQRVATTLGLVDDASYAAKNVSLIATLKALVLGDSAETSNTDDAPELSLEDRNLKTVERLQKQLTVAPVRGSRIVNLNIDHPNPAVAQKIANGYAEVFIADNLDRRFDATAYARKFLEERLQQLKLKLEESEKQLVAYAEQQGIINIGDNKNLTTDDLETVNKRLSEAKGERIKRELLWKQAQQADGFGLKEILESKAIQENRRLRSELAATYQQRLAIYKPAFPEMAQLRNQIKELDRSVQTEVQAIKSSIEASYLAAKEEEETLLVQLESTKSDVVDQRNRSIEYNIIQRDLDTNRQLYDGLLQRYKEIGVAGGVGTNNVSIVDRAVIPLLPRSPNLILNLALGLISGLMLGVLTALLLDYLDDTFKAPEDVERDVGIPVIGVLPLPARGVTVEEDLLDARSPISEAVRSLRTGLQFATSEGLPKTLLITSSKPSEGKTTVSVTLAKSIASLGLNVLLIDGDLRNASVHKRIRCSNEVGLSNFLTGSRLPDDCVQATDTDGLVVMTSGPLPPNPAELLSGPRIASLLSMAQESFNIVIIDGPPVMGLADAPLLSSSCSSTMLVVAANETRKSVVKVALRRLQFARANIIGSLLNKFNPAETGYGYGYGYGDYEYHSYGAKELPAPSN